MAVGHAEMEDFQQEKVGTRAGGRAQAATGGPAQLATPPNRLTRRSRARTRRPQARENLEEELYTREEELAARDQEMQVAAEVGRALAEEREKAAREAKTLTRTNSNLVSQVRGLAPPRSLSPRSRPRQRDKLQSLLDIERRHLERRAEKQAVRRLPQPTPWRQPVRCRRVRCR